METQKIVNLLNESNNESSRFATRKWYIINDQNNRQYDRGSENDSTIKFETKVIKPNLCDYIFRCIYSCDWKYKSCRCCCKYLCCI